MTFKDIKIIFGEQETDILAEYTACMNFTQESDGKLLIYDELPLITSLHVEMYKDILFPHLVTLKLDTDDKAKKNVKDKPTKAGLELSTREYKHFRESMALTLNEVKKMLNDEVMLDGIPFPYANDELYTTIDFINNSTHIFIEIEDNAA